MAAAAWRDEGQCFGMQQAGGVGLENKLRTYIGRFPSFPCFHQDIADIPIPTSLRPMFYVLCLLLRCNH